MQSAECRMQSAELRLIFANGKNRQFIFVGGAPTKRKAFSSGEGGFAIGKDG